MQSDSIDITISDDTFSLLPSRAMHWHSKSTLIVSDLHLGKSGHFRKSGIAAPNGINQTNITRLDRLIQQIQPQRLLLLGDLFHSDVNREWFQFEEWRLRYRELSVVLVEGNHDTLHDSFYESADIRVVDQLVDTSFLFIHDFGEEETDDAAFVFSGHVHPGVRLKGKGRQSLRLPCFYQKSHHMILPAFGEFTGLYILPDDEADGIYPIAENRVLQLKRVQS
jgi:DNA ligase-associated metallophosphoesterase